MSSSTSSASSQPFWAASYATYSAEHKLLAAPLGTFQHPCNVQFRETFLVTAGEANVCAFAEQFCTVMTIVETLETSVDSKDLADYLYAIDWTEKGENHGTNTVSTMTTLWEHYVKLQPKSAPVTVVVSTQENV